MAQFIQLHPTDGNSKEVDRVIECYKHEISFFLNESFTKVIFKKTLRMKMRERL